MRATSDDKVPKRYVYRGDPLTEPLPPQLATVLDRHRGQPDALITVLEEIQLLYGYLPERQLRYTARELNFPLSRVYGIATFYNLFLLKPPGRYLVRVCKGTACHVSRSGEVLRRVLGGLGISEEETTPDGLITMQSVACVGACSLAPVMVVNERTYGRVTPDEAWGIIAGLQQNEKPEAEEVAG